MQNLYKVCLCLLVNLPLANIHAQTQTAIFAGGCFWCMEEPFDKLDGVTSTTTGYTAGTMKNPSYEDVSEGETGNTEAVQITFDSEKISYNELLKVFWKNIDPVAVDEQFCDYGSQYRTGIYYFNDKQKSFALKSLQQLKANQFPSETITTEILPSTTFYPAESNHQNYYQNNPMFYKIIRFTCGRDRRLEELWGNK